MSRILDQFGQPFVRERTEARFDNLALPTVLTHSALTGAAMRAFWHGRYDAALRHSREDARAMRREAAMMALIQERKLAVASLKWHLEVDDDRDRQQREMKNGLTKILQSTPRWKRLLMNWLEAIWHGRQGTQWLWKWGQIGGRRALGIRAHYPINGDKIGHTYDHTPYVLVNPGYVEQVQGKAEIITTTEGGFGLVLKGTWRDRVTVHMHETDDADYWAPEEADAIHGIGLRDRLHYNNYLKKEVLANVMDWAERVGTGVTIIRYPFGNKNAQDEAERAAHEMSRRATLTWPIFPEEGGTGGIERIEVATGGAQILLMLVEHFEKHEERYVVGQSLSAGTEGSGLGGTGVADLHGDTKYRITSYDAHNLGETITGTQDEPGPLRIMQRWTYPEMADVPCRFVFDVDPPDAERVLGAVAQCVNMGVDFVKDEVRSYTGLSDPGPDDEVISAVAMQQEQLQLQAQAAGGMGAGGAAQSAQDPHADLLAALAQPDEAFDSLESGEKPEQYGSAGRDVWRYAPRRQGAANPANPGSFSPGTSGVDDPGVSPPIQGPAKYPQPQQLAMRQPAKLLAARSLRQSLDDDNRERIVHHLHRDDMDWHRLTTEDRQEAHAHLAKLTTSQAWRLLHHLSRSAPYDHHGPLAGARDLVAEHLSQREYRPGSELPWEEHHGTTARVVGTDHLPGPDRTRARAALASLPRVLGVEDAYHLPTGMEGALHEALQTHQKLPTRELSEQEQQRSAMRGSLPGEIRDHVRDHELRKIRKGQAQRMLNFLKQLPDDEDWMAAAIAGRGKKGWYEQASGSLAETFGPDTPRFVAVLAATSPRQPVKQNMVMSLRIWREWERAGRPTDREGVFRVLHAVPGATFGSRLPNVIASLMATDAQAVRLSGSKVESFRKNLLGDLDPSTNDVWMANFAGIRQSDFGKKALYQAFTAKVRKVAHRLGWAPAEVQETIWAAFRTLAGLQLQGLTAEQSAQRLLGRPDVAHDDDFASLMKGDADVRAELARSGLRGPGDRAVARGDPGTAGPAAQGRPAAAEQGGEEGRLAGLLENIARRAGEFTTSVDPLSKPEAVAGAWQDTRALRDPAETVLHARDDSPYRYALPSLPTPAGGSGGNPAAAAPTQVKPPAAPTQVNPVLPKIKVPFGLDKDTVRGIHRELLGQFGKNVNGGHYTPLVQALQHQPHHDWLVARHLAGDHPDTGTLTRSLHFLEQHRRDVGEYPHLAGELHRDVSHKDLPRLMARHQHSKDRIKSYQFKPEGEQQEDVDVAALPGLGDEFTTEPLDPQQHPYHPREGESVYLRDGKDILARARVRRLDRTPEGHVKPVLMVEADGSRGVIHSHYPEEAYRDGYSGAGRFHLHADRDQNAELERFHRLGQHDREHWRPYGHSAPGLRHAEPSPLGDRNVREWLDTPGGLAARTLTRRWLRQHGMERADNADDSHAYMQQLHERIHRDWDALVRGGQANGEHVGRMALLRQVPKTLEQIFSHGQELRHPYDRHLFHPDTEAAAPIAGEVFSPELLHALHATPEHNPQLRALARNAVDAGNVPPAIEALGDLHEGQSQARYPGAPPSPHREQERMEQALGHIVHDEYHPDTAAAREWVQQHVPNPLPDELRMMYGVGELSHLAQRAFMLHVAREISGRRRDPFAPRPDAVRHAPPAPERVEMPTPAELRAEAARGIYLPHTAYLPRALQHLAAVARHEPARVQAHVAHVLGGEHPWTRDRTQGEQQDANWADVPGWNPEDAENWLREYAPQVLDQVPHPPTEQGGVAAEALEALAHEIARRSQQERGAASFRGRTQRIDPDSHRDTRGTSQRRQQQWDNPRSQQDREVIRREELQGAQEQHRAEQQRQEALYQRFLREIERHVGGEGFPEEGANLGDFVPDLSQQLGIPEPQAQRWLRRMVEEGHFLTGEMQHGGGQYFESTQRIERARQRAQSLLPGLFARQHDGELVRPALVRDLTERIYGIYQNDEDRHRHMRRVEQWVDRMLAEGVLIERPSGLAGHIPILRLANPPSEAAP